ncbi:sensor histidine kinase [Bifidobacterium leontopitheci]|uniref:Histidine kinase n=1 Tax=Bifidobacterium leontopitheci TaxID=2650774 RepID=A0A6I1GJ93_9BIFI|nr:hypothetical protein [Bifidobacterium leontopitheci]KAB7789696.1 histidine kinase [Bifidobacterium leontopitheci]
MRHPMTGPRRFHPILGTIAAILATLNAADTITLLNRGWFVFASTQDAASITLGLAMTAIIAATTLAVAWFPRQAALATCALWFTLACMPTLIFSMSWTLALDMLFAMVVVMRGSLLTGQLIMDACLLAPMISGTIGGLLHLDYADLTLFAVILGCLNIVMSIIEAAAAKRRRERQRLENEQRQRQEEIVHQLHDDVANRLSYTLLRMEHDDDTTVSGLADEHSRAELDELADEVRKALASTRQAVNILSGRSAADERTSRRDRMSDFDGGGSVGAVSDIADEIAPKAALDRLSGVVSDERRRLERLGITGLAVLPTSFAAGVGRRTLETTEALLRECFANIAKHAEPEGGYVLAVAVRPAGMVVSLSDTPAQAGDAAHTHDGRSTGKGLDHYRRLLEDGGGSLTIADEDGQWTMTAIIPQTLSDNP